MLHRRLVRFEETKPPAGSVGSIGSGAEMSPDQAKIDVDYGKFERGPSGPSGPTLGGGWM